LEALELFPPSCESQMKSLLQTPLSSSLLKIDYVDGSCTIILSEFSLRIDFNFLLGLTNCLLQSPFLTYATNSTSSEPSESRPFELKFEAPSCRVEIPSSSTSPSPNVVVQVSLSLLFNSGSVAFMLSAFTVHVRDGSVDYPPLFTNVSAKLIRRRVTQSQFLVDISLSNAVITLSPLDFNVFTTVSKELQKAADLMVFASIRTLRSLPRDLTIPSLILNLHPRNQG
jgi:hypothetical protein